jgi:hypothetical protein
MSKPVTKPIKLVKGRRMRATRLDGCGRPVYGEDSVAVTKGFITSAYTAQTSDSDEIRVTNAGGETCIFEPAETTFNGYAIEMTFCEVDPGFFSMITGQEVYLNYLGEAIGFTVDTAVGLTTQGFALEVWAGAPSTDACTDENAQGSYGYVLTPFAKGGILGDFTIENGAVTFTLTGASTKDGNAWGKGPYKVMLNAGTPDPISGPLVTALSTTDHLLMIAVEIAPPTEYAGLKPLLDPAADTLSSVAAVVAEDAFLATITVVPDASLTEPVWYEFGDGTWDYVLGGDTTHTYATAGTYTLSASQNGVWVTTTVTVPGV